MIDVVTQGLCALDWLLLAPRFPVRDEKLELDGFQRHPGGQAASVAVALRRWGLRTAFLGAVGDDEPGSFCLDALSSEGVDVSGCRIVAGSASQQAFIVVDPEGGRTILWRRPPQLAQRRFDLPECRWLHLDGHDLEAASFLADQACSRGVPVSLDLEDATPAHLELARRCRVVLCDRASGVELTGLSEPVEVARQLESLVGAPVVGVTWGSQGLFGRSGGRDLHARHRLHTVVDTTGAGDLCNAGMVFGLISGFPIGEAFRLAAAAGAMVCRGVGVFPSIPSRDML